MLASRTESLSRLVRTATPTVIGLLGVLLLAIPLRLAEGHLPTPLIPFVVVYFWTIYSPGYLPAISVFFIGLLQDLLSGGPIGLWSSIYLVVQLLVLSQRSYFQGREQRVVWLGFAVVAVLAGLAAWLATSLVSKTILPLGGQALQLAATVALYPVMAAAFTELRRRVIVEV